MARISKIKKAVIPAAGLGTRFFPITKSIPKEMLPIANKPCIQYLVEEAIKSGIKEIIIITSDEKNSIKEYFSPSKKLETILKEKNKSIYIKEFKKIENLAKFTFIKQPKPLGDGHAILCAKKLLKNEPFAVLFGDDIYDSKIPPLKQMLKQYEKLSSPMVGIQKINKNSSRKYGIVRSAKFILPNIYKIDMLVEKPSPKTAPSNLAIVGKYIVTPRLLKILSSAAPSSKDKELRLIDGMREYIKKGGNLYGCELKGKRFDTGDKEGYLKAVLHFKRT